MQCLPRYWTQVRLRQDPRGWYPSKLFLGCHGRQVEVGSRLVESERVQLATDLRSSLGLTAGRPQSGVTQPDGLLEGAEIKA
jgi:hypothetical protein